MTDDNIAFDRQVVDIEGRFPAMSKDRKGIGADRIKLVITGHDESGFSSDGTEFSDDEFDFGKVIII